MDTVADELVCGVEGWKGGGVCWDLHLFSFFLLLVPLVLPTEPISCLGQLRHHMQQMRNKFTKENQQLRATAAHVSKEPTKKKRKTNNVF